MRSRKQVKAVSSFGLIVFPVILVTVFSVNPNITDFHAETFCSSSNSSQASITKIVDEGDERKISVTGVINTSGAEYSYRARTRDRNGTPVVKIMIERPELMPLPGCSSGDWRSKYRLNLSVEPETDKIKILPELSEGTENISEETVYLNKSE